MRGLVLAEQAHAVLAVPPKDVTGGGAGDIFTMEGHGHASIFVAVGVSAAAPTSITVKACSDNAGSDPEAIPFDYYAQETAAGDVAGARQSATASGITPSANDNVFYQIELDAAELPDGKPWVLVEINNGTNSVLAAVLVLLSGGRYQGPESPTVLS